MLLLLYISSPFHLKMHCIFNTLRQVCFDKPLFNTTKHYNNMLYYSTFIKDQNVPLLCQVCLIFTIATYKPPSYGDYRYPTYGNVIGWILALLPVIPLVVVPLCILYQSKGSTLKKVCIPIKCYNCVCNCFEDLSTINNKSWSK